MEEIFGTRGSILNLLEENDGQRKGTSCEEKELVAP